MLILTIRTDKPIAEIGLYDGGEQMAYRKWQAHRELSITIHQKIQELLKSQNKDWKNITGIICFKGPGSFTGLRIGLSVANALAYSLGIPIVSLGEKNWIEKGIQQLSSGKNEKIALPKYGAPVRTTKPKK